MKEEVKKSVEKKKNDKLKIEDIKKNASSDVIHTIKRIKLDEAKFVGTMVVIILIVFCFVGFGIYLSIQNRDINKIVSGPLVIEFDDDSDGMSDIVNITDSSSDSNSDYEIVERVFSISNKSDKNSKYIVYVQDYNDMIEYDDCGDLQYSKDKIYFGFNNSLGSSLSSVYKDGRYVIKEGKISPNDKITLDLSFWILDKKDEHFHGEIVVEYVK